MKSNKFTKWLTNLFFPNHIKCVFCGEELNENATYDTCEYCLNTLPFITHPCARCGDEIKESYSSVCAHCAKNNYHFTQAKSVFEYTNKVLGLVHKFKYNHKRYLAEPMVQFMSETFATWNISIDFVCDVPMHKNKLKKRKKNHSTILANMFADMFGLEYIPAVNKIIDKPSQTTLSFKERHKNVENNFEIETEYKQIIKDKNILIIDDVITTCATINEIAKTLKNAGAKAVYALSFAHTPLNKDTKKH